MVHLRLTLACLAMLPLPAHARGATATTPAPAPVASPLGGPVSSAGAVSGHTAGGTVPDSTFPDSAIPDSAIPDSAFPESPAPDDLGSQGLDPAWHMLEAPLAATHAVPADYPGPAWTQGIEGTCDIQVFVDHRGQVDSAYAAACPTIFEAAALEAALGWQFKPHLLGGQAARSTFELPFRFQLTR